MNRNGRHGKVMNSYEEAIMDLMIRVEKGERYLKRHDDRKNTRFVLEDGEEEQYPSFAIRGRKHIEPILTENIVKTVLNEEPALKNLQVAQIRHHEVRLSAWEWLEARKDITINLILLFSILFLQIYNIWKDMDPLSLRILNSIKYMCIAVLVWKLIRWVRKGELRTYLNEES